jgi:hypothetical protein
MAAVSNKATAAVLDLMDFLLLIYYDLYSKQRPTWGRDDFSF